MTKVSCRIASVCAIRICTPPRHCFVVVDKSVLLIFACVIRIDTPLLDIYFCCFWQKKALVERCLCVCHSNKHTSVRTKHLILVSTDCLLLKSIFACFIRLITPPALVSLFLTKVSYWTLELVPNREKLIFGILVHGRDRDVWCEEARRTNTLPDNVFVLWLKYFVEKLG